MTTREILPLPESTYRLLLDAAGAWPDGIATQWIPDPADYARCLDWTYAELAGTVTRIANALTALGVRREDAVTLSSVNTSMLYAATLAAQAAGIAAPVNPALSGERIAELIRRTGSRVLVAAGPELDPQLWQRLLEVARQAGMTAVLALRPDGARGDPPALTGDAPAGGTPNGRGPVVAYLDEVIAGQPDSHLAGADLPEADDLAAFVHTGGTTGAPKVAAHTHANQLACGRGIALCSGLAAGEGMLGGLPLFHVNALIVTGIAPMFSGARVVWPGPAGYRDKALYARFWTDRRALPDRGDVRRPHRLRHPGAGPGRRRHQHAARADRRRGPAAGLGARGLRRSHRAAPAGRLRAHRGDLRQHLDQAGRGTARVGRPRPARPAGQSRPDRRDGSWADCAPGETGVLVIGGPAVFAGYVTDPDLGGPRVSRDGIVHDGWLDTGDLGIVDAGGFVYLTGRAKDLIIRGGHNIDPRVIEDGAAAPPRRSARAVAVGRPDRHSGEVPVAYVVPADPGRFEEADLLAWAADAIDEPAARPKRIYPMTEIPVTAVGKPFKPALLADAAVRAITEALTAAGVADARVTAAHEDGRLVVTVTGADPDRVRKTPSPGSPSPSAPGRRPPPRPPASDPQKETRP